MAIKRTINSAAPITKIKAPLNKAVVGVKKDEQTIKPEEEVIEVVESVSVENPTPSIPEIDIPEHFFDMPVVDIPERRFEETETKLAKERKFAKIALCLGIVVLVIMIINKK
jgi:hypothetical protein